MIVNKCSYWILLPFTIVSLTLSVEINTDNVHLTGSGSSEEINCTTYNSCRQCADVPVCGWIIEKQICCLYSNQSLLESSIVVAKEFCTEYNVSLTTIDTDYWIKVVVSNIEENSVNNFLNEHAVINFYVEDKSYNASINNGVMALKWVKVDVLTDRIRKTHKINPLHIFYFLIIVNGVKLKFNDPRDHYISYHSWSCPKADCSITYWESDSRKYYCKWCLKNDDCRIAAKQQDSCDIRNATNNAKMVRKTVPSSFDVNGPDLAIESVKPDVLLFTRNTSSMLYITVKNHRFLSDDESTKVTVSGQDCSKVTTVDDRTIKCTVSYYNDPTMSVEGPVVVEYAYNTTAVRLKSAQTFKFVVPSVTGVNPTCGPVTGGTRIELTGQYLNVTTEVGVFFNSMSTPMCKIKEMTRDRISCVTMPLADGKGRGADVGPLLIVVDKMKGTFYRKKKFSYVSEPTVLDGQVFAGIASGDVPLIVRGDFECTGNQQMYVDYKGTTHYGLCAVRDYNGTKAMYCRPPKFDSPAKTTELPLGFTAEMDGKVVRMQKNTPIHYLMYRDPVYVDFEVYNQNYTVHVNGLFPDPMQRRQLDGSYYFEVALLGLQPPDGDDDDDVTLCLVIEVTDSYVKCWPPSGTSLAGVLEIAIVVPDGQAKRTVVVVPRRHKQYHQILKSMQKSQCLIGGFSVLIVCVIAVMFSVKKIRDHSKRYTRRRYMSELRNITAGIEDSSDYLLQDSNTPSAGQRLNNERKKNVK